MIAGLIFLAFVLGLVLGILGGAGGMAYIAYLAAREGKDEE